MAKKVQTIVTVIDDWDDKPIDDGLAETIDFSWDGASYTIDLRPTNAEKFRKDVEKWVAASTKVTGRRGRPKGSVAKASAGTSRPGTGSGLPKETLAQIREWAGANGHTVSPRGRISAPVIEAWEAAHKPAS